MSHQCNTCMEYGDHHDLSQHDDDRSYGYDKYTDPYWASDEYKAFVAAKIAKQEAHRAEIRKQNKAEIRKQIEFSDLVAVLLWYAGMAGCAWLLAWQMGWLDILWAVN